MITGELKSKIDRIWDAFWSGGTPNPLEVIEQITYLLFIRRLDDLHTLAERKANRVGGPIQDPIFKPGQNNLRWSHFKSLERDVMHKVVGEQVFPFLQKLRGDGSTYSEHMKDARFTIPTAQLLGRVVDMLDDVPTQDRDTNGDLYGTCSARSPLGLFVRSLVGLDREAATEAFSDFLADTTFTVDQIRFVNLIVEHLTDNGVMEARRLYESPFTDHAPHGPDMIFPEAVLDGLILTLDTVRAHALPEATVA